MDYFKKQNESDFDYIIRLVEGKSNSTYDIDYVELFKLAFGIELAPDECRKRFYGLKMILSYIDKEKVKNISSDDFLKEYELKQRELFKERQKLRDEKSEYHNTLREQSRLELFLERIDEAADKIANKKTRVIPSPIQNHSDKTEIVCAFADAHYGVQFDIRGFNNEIINVYSPEIFMERMWTLRDEILEFCKINNTKKVSIVDLGDSVEGILHISQLKSLRGNVVDDILDYAEFIVDWLEDLSKHICIDFYTSEGNHSDLRLLTGNKGDFPHENLEKIYSRTVQRLLKDNPNVKIHKSLNGLNYFNVNGFNILTAHGNNEKNIRDSIKEYEDLFDIKIDYMLVGHLHSKKEIETSRKKEVIQVRSVMGVNEYSANIKKSSKAGALIFSVHDGYGKKYVNEVKF